MYRVIGMFFYAFFLLTVTATSVRATVKIYNSERGLDETNLNTGLLPGILLPDIHSGSQSKIKKLIIK